MPISRSGGRATNTIFAHALKPPLLTCSARGNQGGAGAAHPPTARVAVRLGATATQWDCCAVGWLPLWDDWSWDSCHVPLSNSSTVKRVRWLPSPHSRAWGLPSRGMSTSMQGSRGRPGDGAAQHTQPTMLSGISARTWHAGTCAHTMAPSTIVSFSSWPAASLVAK